MNDKTIVKFLGILFIGSIIYNTIFIIGTMRNNEEQEKAISILNDCCRNMVDNYGDPDSLYVKYLDILEEEGFDKRKISHSYFCY